MKRITTLLFGIVMTSAAMAQSFKYVYKGVEFKCKMNGNDVCITSFNSSVRDVTIPASVSYKGVDYPVKQVSTFMNGVNYLTVNMALEEGIEDIDKFCFNEFRKLENVSLPSTIRHIGKNAFRDNNRLTFAMCSPINELSIRQGVELWSEKAQENMRQIAQQEKGKAVEEERLKNELKEQKRLLAEAEKEKQRLLAEAGSKSPKETSGKLTGVLTQKKKDTEKLSTSQNNEMQVQPPVDVDMDIPVNTLAKNQNTYCVIIANEKYADVPEVEFAQRDGEIFKEYCTKTLGVPEKQIKMFLNASYTDIKRALNWMETMADVTDGKSQFLFYYAGHGMPDEKEKTAYLIPTDGFPKDISTCFKLSDIYGRLGKMKTENITVLLDACFSGVKRGTGQALVAARGIAIKPKEEVLSGNMVVFTAASDDETALSYQEKRHGMFTYFLLNKLKESKGQISFGELFTAVASDVKKNSMLENDKLQTPSVNVSASMKNKWKDLHF
ncbi:MAG: caspase family protein [Bacteroidaceae bacterium]|nr:caspase family protein [Bacteroidaceae bacterium]